MIAKGVALDQIEQAANDTGVRLYNVRQTRNGWGFTLKTDSARTELLPDWRGKLKHQPRYQRLSQRERTSYAKDTHGQTFYPVVPGAVCWHGHRDFFRALFRLVPDAEIRTAMATYKGAEHFEQTFGMTRYEGGSRMGVHMLPYVDACTCGETERGV